MTAPGGVHAPWKGCLSNQPPSWFKNLGENHPPPGPCRAAASYLTTRSRALRSAAWLALNRSSV